MSEQDVQHIVDLLIKHRRNDLSEVENSELQSWINQNQELFEELASDQIFKELWEDYLSNRRIFTIVRNRIAPANQLEESETASLGKISRRIKPGKWWAAAAVILLV